MLYITILQVSSTSSSQAITPLLLIVVLCCILYLKRQQNKFLGNYNKSYSNLVQLFTGLKILSLIYGILGFLILFSVSDKIAKMFSFISQFQNEQDNSTMGVLFFFFLGAVFLQSYIGYAIGAWGIRYVKNKSEVLGAPITQNPDALANTGVNPQEKSVQ